MAVRRVTDVSRGGGAPLLQPRLARDWPEGAGASALPPAVIGRGSVSVTRSLPREGPLGTTGAGSPRPSAAPGPPLGRPSFLPENNGGSVTSGATSCAAEGRGGGRALARVQLAVVPRRLSPREAAGLRWERSSGGTASLRLRGVCGAGSVRSLTARSAALPSRCCSAVSWHCREPRLPRRAAQQPRAAVRPRWLCRRRASSALPARCGALGSAAASAPRLAFQTRPCRAALCRVPACSQRSSRTAAPGRELLPAGNGSVPC